MNTVADAVAAQLRTLPPLPLVAKKLIAKMAEAEPSAPEIARLIASDDALTARLLRLVNSPFFGLQRQIASVPEALHVIGLNAVQRLVVSAAVMHPFAALFQDPRRAQAFWRHRLRCGLTARQILRDASAELAFVAGLLHEIGELGMLAHFGAAYASRCFEQSLRGAARVQAERAAFGLDHAQLGAAILSRWSLPPPVCRSE
ncbi:MAG TPA: HDOD domain-containing protein [Burkholderiaceae bacterium]|nr:HDOD domain-containing protein [Burkholderiaceae bacterium]